MPHREVWEAPQVFCTLADGCKIYHTYPEDDLNQGPHSYWFTCLPMASESCSQETDWAFDVRRLPAVPCADVETDQGKRAILQAAYNCGFLRQYLSCPGGCDSCASLQPQHPKGTHRNPSPLK